MTEAEFEAAWRAKTPQERDQWVAEAILPAPPGGSRAPYTTSIQAACAVGEALEARGLAEDYGLALAVLCERGGVTRSGAREFRLAHASAELRCRAALMAALKVEG